MLHSSFTQELLGDFMFELSKRIPLHRVNDYNIQYVSLLSKYNEKWVICHLRDRDTWDCPGGRIETNEKPIMAAKRELFEETGTTKAEFYPLFIYEITSDRGLSYGIQYFCKILEIGPIPDFEMDKIEFVDTLPLNKLRTPQVHSVLMEDLESILGKGMIE